MLKNIGSLKILSFAAALMAVPIFAEAAEMKTANSAVENFESDTAPNGCIAGKGSELIVTPERFKSGAKSLRWTWTEPESSITVAAPGGSAQMGENDCLAFWVYNERPAEEILWLELLRDGNVVGRCWYVLNFKGWRPFAAPYKQIYLYPEHFITNPLNTTLNAIRLTAPAFRMKTSSGVKNGCLYLDYVNFNCHDKPYADDQQPWIGRPEILSTATPEKFIYSSHDISLNRSWLPRFVTEENFSDGERKDMDKIAMRCIKGDMERGIASLVPGIPAALKDEKVLDECRNLLKIRRSQEGIITGVPIVSTRTLGTRSVNSPPDGVEIGELLRRLVRAYLYEETTGTKEAAEVMRQLYFDICDHLMDQGFAEGNGSFFIATNSPGYNVTGFFSDCILPMRSKLEETGRWRGMLLGGIGCALVNGSNFLTVEDWERSGYLLRNTDIYIQHRVLLSLIILLPVPAERLQRLKAYSRAISCLCDPGLGEPYAWDGTTHHHPMFHIAYCGGALIGEACSLAGTVFRLTPEGMAVLKRGFMAMAFMAGPASTVPPNIPGYAGQPLGVRLRELALALAYCDTAGSRNGIDPDAAAVYLSTVGENSPAPQAKKFLELSVKPFNFEGHKTLNGASIALHRRGDWLVSIAGQYKFRRPYEANAAYIASAFNHYSRNGSVFVVSSGNPPSPWDSGFSLEGWDSRHQPGTTCYLGETEAQLRNRTGNPGNAFAGGTDMDGDGIWGMEFAHQSATTADNIKFHKSAFCFGNRITLITTDIGRGPGAGGKERDLQLATTLFQNAIGSVGETEQTEKGVGRFGLNPPKKPAPVSPEQEACWVNGEKVTGFPFEKSLPGGAPRILVDNKRTGYYVHPESPALKVTRREQQWNYIWHPWAKKEQAFPKDDPRNFEPTVGNFATAWFDHGSKPDTTECVYTLIPETTPEAMRSFAKEMAKQASVVSRQPVLSQSNGSSADKKQDQGPATGDQRPYEILQKDSKAHIVWDRDSNTTAYILFDPSWSNSPTNDRRLTTGDLLLKANRPCSVMLREKDGNLRLSAASTDMDSWPGWAESKVYLSGDIVLSIAGKWEIAKLDADATQDCSAANANGITSVKIPYKTFMSARMLLKPVK